jgi:cation diffusion facilitator CzcD-associated flavoprotein CzcO
MRSSEVAIVGAGPYGLSVAAHLKHRGVDLRIFGSPMSFWLQMPASINLKSFAWATNVAVPQRHFTFTEYCRTQGLEDLEPCSMESFAAYGLWVQRTLVPEVEGTHVAAVRAAGGGFEIDLLGGETLRARRVVIATGLEGFAHVPAMLAALPGAVVTHSSEHRTYAEFAGRDVAVIGGGASALEAATMLHEAGARPLVLVRGASVEFHTRFDPHRSLLERIKAPNSVIGPGRKSWVLEKLPLLLHSVPEARRVRFTRGYLGAAGPWWLQDRFEGKVQVRTGTRVMAAEVHGSKLALEVNGPGRAETLLFDHAIAGTGFQVDVDRMAILDPDLRARIRRVERAPSLSLDFESSVPGLFFVGASAAWSFGPLFRFVTGATVAAPRVARRIERLTPARARHSPAEGRSRASV